jgi:hypothetical protein
MWPLYIRVEKAAPQWRLISNRLLRHRVSVETARLYLVELAAARTRLAEAQRQSK